MGNSISDFAMPLAIGSMALAPMLFPAAAGVAAGAGAGAAGVAPFLGPATFAGTGSAAMGAGAAGGLGGLFSGLGGVMKNPLFKMGTNMLMGQMSPEQQQQGPMTMPSMPSPMIPSSFPGGGLADAAAAPRVMPPNMTMDPSGRMLPPPGGMRTPYLPLPSFGRQTFNA